MTLVFTVFFLYLLTPSLAHIRLTYPVPRSTDTGLKSYPCGGLPFWGVDQNHTDIMPGPLVLRWEETINHIGTSFRIAISPNDDTQYDSFILADQIPHHDLESSSKFYDYVVDIPNIDCPQCSLQIINPMTDKLSSQGATCCTYPDQPLPSQPGPTTIHCFSVYHTCANIRILGSIPLSQYVHTYTGPCGPYSVGNTGQWVLNGTSTNDYVLANPDYIPSLNNTCPLWQSNCTGSIQPAPTPDTPAPDAPAPEPDAPAPDAPAPDAPAPDVPAPDAPAPDAPAPDTPAPDTPAPDAPIPAPDAPAPDAPAPAPDAPAPDAPAPDAPVPAPDAPAPNAPAPDAPVPAPDAPVPAPDAPAPNAPAPDAPVPAPDAPAPGITTETSTSSPISSSPGELTAAAIAGIVIAVLVILAVLVGLLLLCGNFKKRDEDGPYSSLL